MDIQFAGILRNHNTLYETVYRNDEGQYFTEYKDGTIEYIDVKQLVYLLSNPCDHYKVKADSSDIAHIYSIVKQGEEIMIFGNSDDNHSAIEDCIWKMATIYKDYIAQRSLCDG